MDDRRDAILEVVNPAFDEELPAPAANDDASLSLYEKYKDPAKYALIIAAAATPVVWGLVMVGLGNKGTPGLYSDSPTAAPTPETNAPSIAPTVFSPPECGLADNISLRIILLLNNSVVSLLEALMLHAMQNGSVYSVECDPIYASQIRSSEGSEVQTDISVPLPSGRLFPCVFQFDTPIRDGSVEPEGRQGPIYSDNICEEDWVAYVTAYPNNTIEYFIS